MLLVIPPKSFVKISNRQYLEVKRSRHIINVYNPMDGVADRNIYYQLL
jgi:hypothetical protein